MKQSAVIFKNWLAQVLNNCFGAGGGFVDGLFDTVRRMVEIEPTIASELDPVTQVGLDPDKEIVRNTVLHPRLRGLNALEWFQPIEIHYCHNLLLKMRLDDAWREVHG